MMAHVSPTIISVTGTKIVQNMRMSVHQFVIVTRIHNLLAKIKDFASPIFKCVINIWIVRITVMKTHLCARKHEYHQKKIHKMTKPKNGFRHQCI